MTEQEFERLKRRFGADVSAWPAPYSKEAERLFADTEAASGPDDALDGLILDAAAAETDEAALTREVLARIRAERQRGFLSDGLSRLWTMPAAASGFAALLLLAAISGYVAAGDAPEGLDDALLALALGDGGLGAGSDLLGEFPGEEQL